MDNKLIAEKVFHLITAIRHKNEIVARSLQSAIVGLLEHPQPLISATPETLRCVKGVGPKTVKWIARIIGGESIEAIAVDIPEWRRSPAPKSVGGSQHPDLGNWDGSWDNIVRTIEDK
jgi:hypothetical protein